MKTVTQTASQKMDAPRSETTEPQDRAAVCLNDTLARKVMELPVVQYYAPQRAAPSAWWAAESLREKKWFTTPRRPVAETSRMCVALPGFNELSPAIRTWLSQVLADCSEHDRAMVILLAIADEPGNGSTRSEGSMSKPNAGDGMDYFEFWYQLQPPATAAFFADLHERAASLASELSALQARTEAVQHWGINE
jgi:hypothetical protein